MITAAMAAIWGGARSTAPRTRRAAKSRTKARRARSVVKRAKRVTRRAGGKAAKFVKGSAAAKRHMARLRKMRRR